ncbi:hypothetical protein GHT06_014546 [Daphnia sinensis]|uniref:Fibrillar collagen NC1 domain-containing protein n=1 Tax=Daphnia sinensis TaxID=1820382 RepID=A0AAD5KRV3_9CRUS|nr:hypothetical protein GHT06_014546 [Daphnia sinensis]
MGRNFARTIRSFLIILALPTCCLTTAPPDLHARVEQLEKNYGKIKEQLEAKIVDLETKVGQLEAIVEKQDSLLAVLKKGHKPLKENIDINQHRRQNATLRTCHEIHVANPSYPSGMYWIDPDGQGIGDPPIHVYCGMEEGQRDGDWSWSDPVGTTSILHDSESKMDIGNCIEPGCYSRPIKYYASDRQVEALIQLSTDCHQRIKYHCRKAPFNYKGIAYAWWNDKDGKRHEFSNWLTTCDKLSDTEFTENGLVNDKRLPFTRFYFSNPLKGSGQHRVSRLRCYGKAKTEAMPRSCEDLWRMGHTLNGIYSVKGAKQIETVFCQFDKRPNEQDFQKKIGYQDIKTRPVYFYVKRASYSPLGTFISDVVNIGGAMDTFNGVFTAPVTGTYFFSLVGYALVHLTTSIERKHAVCIYWRNIVAGAMVHIIKDNRMFYYLYFFCPADKVQPSARPMKSHVCHVSGTSGDGRCSSETSDQSCPTRYSVRDFILPAVTAFRWIRIKGERWQQASRASGNPGRQGTRKSSGISWKCRWNCPSFVLVCKTNFELVTKMVADLVNGELMQLDASATEDERFAHYFEKTFYLQVSVLAGADTTLQSIAFQFGGMAFQLVDDVLDLATDLREGLAIAPVLFAAYKFPELNPLIRRQFNQPQDGERAYHLVHCSDGLQRTKELANQ